MDSDSAGNELFGETCHWQITYIIHIIRENSLIILDVCTRKNPITNVPAIATELNKCGYISHEQCSRITNKYTLESM